LRGERRKTAASSIPLSVKVGDEGGKLDWDGKMGRRVVEGGVDTPGRIEVPADIVCVKDAQGASVRMWMRLKTRLT